MVNLIRRLASLLLAVVVLAMLSAVTLNGRTASADTCQPAPLHCGPMANHGGPVMHSVEAFLIFWMPNGSPTPVANYEQTITNFFNDVGGTPYFNMLQQYPGNNGNPGSTLSLGGVWVDSQTPYPRAGTTGDPLQDGDIQNEVNSAISNNSGWDATTSRIYFVYTAPGIESCALNLLFYHGTCTFPNTFGLGKQYCAYHSKFHQGLFGLGQEVIYANMPYVGGISGCTGIGYGPNDQYSDVSTDAEISATSLRVVRVYY